MRICKAVIPADDPGGGFLPAAKARVKQILPIIDKPAIRYLVEQPFAPDMEVF
jgi:UTP--glucose-1-phosphate uridylyltransferase